MVSDLPSADREILNAQSILALLLVPLTVRDEFFGFIGFDNCEEARRWTTAEVDFLSAAAAAISIAIEKRSAQLALQQQQEFVTYAADARPSGEWTWNAIADEVTFDKALASLLGTAGADVPSTWAAWCACVYPDDRAQWTQALQTHLHDPAREFRCDRRLVVPGSPPRWFRAIGHSQMNEHGHLEALTVIETDITETKLATELHQSLERLQHLESKTAAMERRNRSKDDFLNAVSHELRSPMSNMKLSIRMLKLASDKGKREQYLDILERECAREIDLIDDLLDLQRLDYQGEELTLRTIRLSEWLAPIIQPFRLRAEQRQIQFDLDIKDA
ncbi:MAG: histidine kinase dimerization/phospho-acceptor domain-containing protein, partial [Cyanobacteria bacterium J06648_11]